MLIAITSWSHKNKFNLKLSHAEYQLCYSDVSGTAFFAIQVHRKKMLFNCSHWQMTTTTTSLTDISACNMRLGIVSNSLLITVISKFLYIFLEWVLSGEGKERKNMCQTSPEDSVPKYAKKQERPRCTAAAFPIHKPPPSFIHSLTITRTRVGVRVSGYGWRGNFPDISSNRRAETYN